jgi:TIGR03009 family protein
MRRDMRRVLVLAVVATTSGFHSADAQGTRPPAAQPARQAAAQPARPAPTPNDARMKQLLKVWEQRSALLKTLDVKITRSDKSEAWGNEEFEGRAILQSPNLAWLDFKKVSVDDKGKAVLKPYERIVCTGTEVWQYRSDARQIFIFPLEKKDQKRALEEGPLPFLFNMKASEAEARYLMTLVSEDKDFYVISVAPRLRVDQEAFSKAFLKLNGKTFLPDRIFLVSPDGKSTKDFTLTEVHPNAQVMSENFVGKPLPKPWQISRDPGGNGGQNMGARPPMAAPLHRR